MRTSATLDPDGWQARSLWWVIVGLLAVGFGACIATGANGPADPTVGGARIEGFGEIRVTIQRADGSLSPTQLCALLAESRSQLRRGLMTVEDLAGYTGMVFRFSADTDGAFYMRNTPMPLSIAWFASDGRFISSSDMAPCGDQEGCPTYSAAGTYRVALEVPAGELATIGVGPGSVLQLDGACEPQPRF